MENFIKKYKLGLIGIVLGGILGYAYYHFIGCNTGTCAITSKPYQQFGLWYGDGLSYSFNFRKTKKINKTC